MEIIDAHAHIYPNKIAEKATETIGAFYDIKMETPAGTVENLIEDGAHAGITRYVVHSCATKPQQVRSINQFIKNEIDAHKEFIGFNEKFTDIEMVFETAALPFSFNHKSGISTYPAFSFDYYEQLLDIVYHLNLINDSGELQLSAAIKKILNTSDNCDEQGYCLCI